MMSKNISAHRHFHATRRAVMIAACLIVFGSRIFALAVKHSHAAQGKPSINNLWQDVAESSIPARGVRQAVADVNWVTIIGDSTGIGNGQVSYTDCLLIRAR